MRQDVESYMQGVRGAIRIPAGARARPCDGPNCRDQIYDVDPAKLGGKRRPVSIKQYKTNPPAIPPTDTEDGCGINHFADCADAPRFR